MNFLQDPFLTLIAKASIILIQIEDSGNTRN